jgi:SAM-dependent methyltransferase
VTGDDYVQRNVAMWQSRHDHELRLARRQWASDEPSWGIFGIREADARLLPRELAGKDVVELGCGTGYVSAWLARRGARPVGLDPTPGQLAIAAQCQEEFGPRFPLVRAVGERAPLRGGSFDLVISEYGAAIWADPHRWIPEAARLLRPGGELVFLGNSTLLMLCAPDEEGVAATEAMVRPQRGMHRFEWDNDEMPTVEFHLGHGDWIRLLRASGFDVQDLVELYAPPGSTTDYDFVTAEWGARWPVEEVWRARLRATATVNP